MRPELPTPDQPTFDERVHEVRRRLKRSRALLRLAAGWLDKPVLRREDRRCRDAARALSGVRDAAVVLECLDRLRLQATDLRILRALDDLQVTLEHLHLEAMLEAGLAGSLAHAEQAARRADEDSAAWPLAAADWPVIRPGLLLTYRRNRKAMRRAARRGGKRPFHAWRKQARFLRYQLEALRASGPGGLVPMAKPVARFGDRLGEDRDLALLARLLETHRKELQRPSDAKRAKRLIERRRAHLQRQALRLGDTLFEEPTKRWGRRLACEWHPPLRARD